VTTSVTWFRALDLVDHLAPDWFASDSFRSFFFGCWKDVKCLHNEMAFNSYAEPVSPCNSGACLCYCCGAPGNVTPLRSTVSSGGDGTYLEHFGEESGSDFLAVEVIEPVQIGDSVP
jgi:hypothetical protein